MSLKYSFLGKRVLVTGGARGIGLGISKLFYEDGAKVHIMDREKGLLDEVKKNMPKVTTICQDLGDWDGTRKVIESLGAMDHLVNNAGCTLNGDILTATEKDYDRLITVNLKALVNSSAAFASAIKQSQPADRAKITQERTIVNISSVADRICLRQIGLYNSTKAAVTSITKAMAREFVAYRIRVNCVCPGTVHTDMLTNASSKMATELADVARVRGILPEPIHAVDIAQSVLFLSSPLASKITATSLLVDGGVGST